MAEAKLKPRFTPSAQVDEISRERSHYRLTIPSGKADAYRVAQLDDYALLHRKHFPHRFPFNFSLSARTSSDSIPGTWGFGLWNDPFGMSLGFGGSPFRLPALPNAVWFFGASKENYLSFSDKPGNGFIAQSFQSPKVHLLLALAGLVFPISRKLARRLMSRFIVEDGVALDVNPVDWHRYSLEWSQKRVLFEVDQIRVFESAVSANPPLGLVIWIDNQYASFTPEGKIGFGVLENPEPAWLEIKEIGWS